MDYDVETIKGARAGPDTVEFLVGWAGFAADDDTWEPASNCSCPEPIDRYWAVGREYRGPPPGSVLEPLSASLRLVHGDVDRALDLSVNTDGEKTWLVRTTTDTGSTPTTTVAELPADEAVGRFRLEFWDRTGNPFGTPLARTPGRYCAITVPAVAGDATWQYYMDVAMDGRPVGWHPYSSDASQTLEDIFGEWCANPDANLHVRSVQSGVFSYRVDFGSMEQCNLKTSTRRRIRRSE